MMNRTRASSLWNVVCGVAHLLASYAALLVFCDGTLILGPSPVRDLNTTYAAWFRYMLLYAGLFSLVYLAVLSFRSERYRSLSRAELTIASAACAIASAVLFAISLLVAPFLFDRGWIPGIIIAVVVVAFSALFVLESLKGRRSENGSTKTRSTAVLLSSSYTVSCFLALIVAHLPMWPRLHIVTDFWNPEFHVYLGPLVRIYVLIVPLLMWCSIITAVLWSLHISVLNGLFQRWHGLPQRWFAFGSFIAGLCSVVVLEIMQVAFLDRIDLEPVDNIAIVRLTILLVLSIATVLATFVIFDVIARKQGSRHQVASPLAPSS